MRRCIILAIAVTCALTMTGCETRSAYQKRFPNIGDRVQQVDELYGDPHQIEELPGNMQRRLYQKKIWSPLTGVMHGYDTHDVTFQNGKVVSYR